MDEISFAQQFVPQNAPTVNDIFRRQLATDWEAFEEARREREQAEAREAQRENMALANRQFGDPLGNVTRCQMAVGEARDRVRALEDQLTEARRVLHRCADEYVTWSEQAEVVTATASRSATHDLLSGAKEALAAERVEQMLAQRSAQAGTPRRAPRPPSVSRGSVVRSEQCADCIDQGATDEEAFLIHNDPDHPLPVRPPEQAANRSHGNDSGYAEAVR